MEFTDKNGTPIKVGSKVLVEGTRHVVESLSLIGSISVASLTGGKLDAATTDVCTVITEPTGTDLLPKESKMDLLARRLSVRAELRKVAADLEWLPHRKARLEQEASEIEAAIAQVTR